MSLFRKPTPQGKDSESAIVRTAVNATRGNKILNAQYAPDGHAVITANGKELPSLNRLADEMGFEQAWEFLTKDCARAHSAVAEMLVKKGSIR